MNKIKTSRPIKRGLVFMIILISALIFISIITNSFNSRITNYKESKIKELQLSYNAIINSYERASYITFNNVINKPEIWNLLEQGASKDTAIVANARQELYTTLLPVYQNLKNLEVRQVHFHLANNKSFLRFHKPSIYGDDLTDIRYSVKATNEQLKPHIGFEEGRIYNGFRYVYPIINDQNIHLGSVEISVNFKAIENELSKLYSKEYYFLIDKNIISEKLFDSEKDHYKTSGLHKQFMIESNTTFSDRTTSINEIIKSKVNQDLSHYSPIIINCKSNKIKSLASFYPITNVQGFKVAYIAAYEEDDTIQVIKRLYYIILFFVISLLTLILLLIMKLKTNNENLRKNEIELKESNQTKDKFFSIIAHDIKGPLSSVIGITTAISNDYDHYKPSKIKQLLSITNHSLQDTYKLLDNLLYWSRSQRGTLDFNPEPVILQEIYKETVEILQQSANNKSISIEEHIPSNLEVKADKNMLSTTLRNLISNAIKFTHKGGVISISATTSPQDKHFALITVKDSGVGIPQEAISNILKLEKNTSTKGTNNESGTGLGLILCKEFVEKHKGTLNISSKVNEGSEFSFTIPMGQMHQ